jgi:hypothetical protein
MLNKSEFKVKFKLLRVDLFIFNNSIKSSSINSSESLDLLNYN